MLDMLSAKRTIRKIFEMKPFMRPISEFILIYYKKSDYVFSSSYSSLPSLNKLSERLKITLDLII